MLLEETKIASEAKNERLKHNNLILSEKKRELDVIVVWKFDR